MMKNYRAMMSGLAKIVTDNQPEIARRAMSGSLGVLIAELIERRHPAMTKEQEEEFIVSSLDIIGREIRDEIGRYRKWRAEQPGVKMQ